MTVTVMVSLRGAPGVTATVLAMVAGWPAGRRVRLVEADPAGGVLAVRYRLDPSRGIGSLAAARRDTVGLLDAHSQALPGGVPVLAAPVAAAHAASSLAALSERLPVLLSADSADVVVDGGRVWPGSPVWALATAADRVCVVVRPVAEEIAAVHAARDTLVGLDAAVRVVTVGARPYPPDDVSAAVNLPVSPLADDRRTAAAFAGRGRIRALARTALVRSAGVLADTLAAPVSGAASDDRPRLAAVPSPEPTR